MDIVKQETKKVRRPSQKERDNHNADDKYSKFKET